MLKDDFLSRIKWLSKVVAFIITGCVGDKVTFSEVAEVEGKGNKVCFKFRSFIEIKNYPLLMVFVLTGCIGDKFTPSQRTLVSKVDGRICFTVLKPGNYSLSYFYLFERGRRDSAQHPEIAEYRTDSSLLLCLSEDTVSSSEIVYVAQFGLNTQTRRKPIRNFSVAFKAYNTGVFSIPLEQNEITYYIGRGY